MQNPSMEMKAKWREELHTLHSVCTVLCQLQTNAAKGKMLVQFLGEYKFIAKYIRYVYDVNAALPKAVAWEAENECPDEATQAFLIAHDVYSRDLQCGLTAFVASKAFVKAGLRPIVYPEPGELKKEPAPKAATMGIEIHSQGFNNVANGTLIMHGEKVGTVQFELDKNVSRAIRYLQSLGIDVRVPQYLNIPKKKRT